MILPWEVFERRRSSLRRVAWFCRWAFAVTAGPLLLALILLWIGGISFDHWARFALAMYFVVVMAWWSLGGLAPRMHAMSEMTYKMYVQRATSKIPARPQDLAARLGFTALMVIGLLLGLLNPWTTAFWEGMALLSFAAAALAIAARPYEHVVAKQWGTPLPPAGLGAALMASIGVLAVAALVIAP